MKFFFIIVGLLPEGGGTGDGGWAGGGGAGAGIR